MSDRMSDISTLVPLDGSAFAESALPYALAASRMIGAKQLELVSVYSDEPVAGGWALSGQRVRDSFDNYQRTLVERLRPVTDLQLVPLVLAGSMPKRLETYVERQEPALVVMSTHGRGPVSRAWLGSVADHTIRHVRSPVLLVHPQNGEVDLAARPAFRRVLVPLDGSALAEGALPMATTVARAAGAALKLVRVVGPHYAVSPYLPHTIAETREATERDREEAEAYLEILKGQLERDGLCVETEVPIGVPAARGILSTVEQARADLVAIATHGRGGFKRVLLGSVADKVVRASPVPVLVIRPTGV